MRTLCGKHAAALARSGAETWISAGLWIAAALPAQTDWIRARLLEPRLGAAMAYDAARERVVLFGGLGEGIHPVVLGGTWEWDGVSWVLRNPATSPPARWQHAMAYDAARQRVVLFGGDDACCPATPRLFGDTWEWDGLTWVQRSPAASPPARSGHAMAYDVARQRVVLFGGGGYNYLADTWEWDGVSWAQRIPRSQNPRATPPARLLHAMAYDVARQRVMLFGGEGSTAFFSDTWEWDGVRWAERSPAASPSVRTRHAMAYDAARQRIVLFGGVGLGDTWEWDGVSWAPRSPAASPTPRSYHAMAYDAAHQRIVLFGGGNALVKLGDTWEWGGVSWARRDANASPLKRYFHALAYDEGRQRVVLFGGADARGRLVDTWEWDGVSWAQRSPAASPSARVGHAMAYDAARQQVVLFGGSGVQAVDTWTWAGVDWTRRSSAITPTTPRISHAMAYDAARQRVVLFGGWDSLRYFGDTWEWDGVSWAQRYPVASPTPRTTAMAYDATRQRVVLFGGYNGTTGTLGDTWEWDGLNWTQQNPAASPSARAVPAMAYDAARQRVILFGGDDDFSRRGDTWEWDGVNWAQQNPATSPPERGFHAVAYDAARQRVVLFGGMDSAYWYLGDTWLYGNLIPAATQTIGSACAGTNGPPVIASNLPFLGNQAFVLDLRSARALAPCLFMLARDTQALQLGGGCTLYLRGSSVPLFAATNAGGFSSVRLSIPLDTSLRGSAAYAQAFVFDPMGSFAGLALSAGLRLVLGD